jgi:hypothetical protein
MDNYQTNISIGDKAEFFLRLIYALDFDVKCASVLWILLAHNADQVWAEISCQDMSQILGNIISRRSVQRTIQSLIDKNLVESKVHRNFNSRYKVNVVLLEQLLSRPLPPSAFLPVFGTNIVPYLTRRQLQQEPLINS